MSAAPFPRSFTPAEAQSSISSFWVCRSLSYCLRLLACDLRALATRSHLGACFCVRTHGKSAHDDNAHGSRTNFTTPVFQSGCSPSKTQTASIVACTPFGGCFTLRSGSCDVGEAGENAHRGVTSVPPARRHDTKCSMHARKAHAWSMQTPKSVGRRARSAARACASASVSSPSSTSPLPWLLPPLQPSSRAEALGLASHILV